MIKKFPNFKQLYAKDCGPSCLKIISKYYNVNLSIDRIREVSETNRLGTNLESLSKAADILGFRSLGVKISLDDLKEAPLPCILFWDKKHYVVLYKIQKEKFFVSDPSLGLVSYNKRDFLNHWINSVSDENSKEGICLLLEVTPELYQNESSESDKVSWKFFSNYLKPHKRFIYQLFLGVLVASILQLLFPFLTQSLVDVGIVNQDLNFIYLVLIAQLFLYIGIFFINIIRNLILTHLGGRIKTTIISDFVIKLSSLKISFFDTKTTGDILERTKDLERIKIFLTYSFLNFVFSSFNLIIFGIILAIYSIKVFLIFFIGTVLYFGWFLLFLKRRALLDEQRFDTHGQERNKFLEIINGMQEIKLHNAEEKKRWKWEAHLIKIFDIDLKILNLKNVQLRGADIINEIKNIIITVYSATLVISGELTLGMLLAIMYIIGQLNVPLNLLKEFLADIQDAFLSFKRISEFNKAENEHEVLKLHIDKISNNENITITNVSFRYKGSRNEALKDISFTIPNNKVTAIVGKSGSGKTTLLKIIMKFYEPSTGNILVGNTNINNISHVSWRNHCGVVFQDGFIFNDTVLNNICVSENLYDAERLDKAIQMANLFDFIRNLPLGYNTVIGRSGVGLSGGEKQRILIARAIYKDPKILLFDEATSSLDTENEKIIVNNLNTYYSNRTTLVIAHRLSTVKNADQIIVMDKGIIVEKGNHSELIKKKNFYYNLVKNQLELGK